MILRELTRATAQRMGQRASFVPIADPDTVGNGVHVHMSLRDRNNRPVSYDATQPYGLSETAGRFVAGILHHMPALCALTAPSVVSYLRLTPHRWSASWNNLGYRDREACVRICPVLDIADVPPIADQFNVEYRAADAAASPYIALGALIWAGLDGIRQGLPVPEATDEDLSNLGENVLKQRGITALPGFLEAALTALEQSSAAREWMGETFLDAYLRHKRTEIAIVKHLEPERQCARYAEVY